MQNLGKGNVATVKETARKSLGSIVTLPRGPTLPDERRRAAAALRAFSRAAFTQQWGQIQSKNNIHPPKILFFRPFWLT